MADIWPALPLAAWSETCDTLHAHTQVLGKLASALAPPEPQLQHAALRLTARGWETLPLPAPDGTGAFSVALDLHAYDVVAEHTDGRMRRISLRPDRSVGAVTRDVLAAVRELAGPVELDLMPQETPWTVPLDEDEGHATFDTEHIDAYFAAATRAAGVLAALRAPYRGRSTPVNAWWGSFDLAVSLFSGRPAEPPSPDFIMRNSMDAEEVAVGWWPGDARYPRAAFYAYAHPASYRRRSMPALIAVLSLATLAAARRLRSSYCCLMHGTVLREQFGEPVLDIALDHRSAGLDEVDVAVMDLAERVVDDATSIGDADLKPLRDLGLTEAEIMDVVLAAAARCFFSKTLDGIGVLPDARFRDLDSQLLDALVVGRPIAAADDFRGAAPS